MHGTAEAERAREPEGAASPMLHPTASLSLWLTCHEEDESRPYPQASSRAAPLECPCAPRDRPRLRGTMVATIEGRRRCPVHRRASCSRNWADQDRHGAPRGQRVQRCRPRSGSMTLRVGRGLGTIPRVPPGVRATWLSRDRGCGITPELSCKRSSIQALTCFVRGASCPATLP